MKRAKASGVSSINRSPVEGRCPSCRNRVTFNSIGQDHVAGGSGVSFGFRICPTPGCKQVIAYADKDHQINFWPAERIDFDPKGVPAAVVNTFEEALTCHAEACYRAAAMAVRLTLETICDDQGAEGEKLYQRVDALVEKVVLPRPLLEVMHDIRWLGNDAAHIELKKFHGVGSEEVEVAIELTKEIMKGLYQLDGLVERFRALKKI